MKKASAALAVEEPSVSARRIEYMPLGAIQPAKRNPKLHAMADISGSIAGHGFVEVPTLDERTQRLVAGHGRIEALRARAQAGEPPPDGVQVGPDGEWFVPILRGWGSKNDTQAENYIIASNQLTTAGGWSMPDLTPMLRDLAQNEGLENLGFSATELESMLSPEVAGAPDPDAVPPLPKDVWVKPGQMFQLGKHRILCGDCTELRSIEGLIAQESADICWTDPPWNVAYGEDENPAGWSKKKHKVIENDNLGEAFPGFCAAFCATIQGVLKPGAALYMAMSAQEWPTIDGALRHQNFHWSSTIIWTKDSLVLSRKDYHTQYEPIWYGWLGDAARLHPLRDRKQSDVWSIPRPKRSDLHPTMKPVELVARALRNSSGRGALVFEPFSGSGSTLMACEVTGRACRAIELDPAYVQVAIERWERFTSRKAEEVR